MCKALSEFNLQINRLDVSAATAISAGTALQGIFPRPSEIHLELKTLSVRVDEDSNGHYHPVWPDILQLDKILGHTLERFPKLQTLAISSFYDCIPVLPTAISFSNLSTIVFDGSIEQEDASIALITTLLHNTPQLETLWLKGLTREQPVTVMNSTIPPTPKNSDPVKIPVFLPRLIRLAISVPGVGLDLLYCIEAPTLHHIHIDGSRGHPYKEFTGRDVVWTISESTSVQDGLRRLALRSPGVRCLAVTSTYLTHAGWEWLLFGNGRGPPFPQLDSVALHGMNLLSDEVSCGFDDALLLQYSREPSITLRRLALLRCRLLLSESALVKAFESAISGVPNKAYELEIDTSSFDTTFYHFDALKEKGVRVVHHQEDVPENEWWSHGHQVDALDSHAY